MIIREQRLLNSCVTQTQDLDNRTIVFLLEDLTLKFAVINMNITGPSETKIIDDKDNTETTTTTKNLSG